MDDAITTACWQFNEATSLLRSARSALRPGEGAAALAEEIDEGIPAIQAALEGLAAYISKETSR